MQLGGGFMGNRRYCHRGNQSSQWCTEGAVMKRTLFGHNSSTEEALLKQFRAAADRLYHNVTEEVPFQAEMGLSKPSCDSARAAPDTPIFVVNLDRSPHRPNLNRATGARSLFSLEPRVVGFWRPFRKDELHQTSIGPLPRVT